MILSDKELRKRDVVNISDGRSFGKITDLQLDFPCGTLKGIVVCDRRRGGIFGFWCKNEIFIDERNIIRIGGDVILVNIKNSDVISSDVVEVNDKRAVKNCGSSGSSQNRPPRPAPCPPPVSPCPPPVVPCQPPVPPCPPQQKPCENDVLYGEDVRIDFEDY